MSLGDFLGRVAGTFHGIARLPEDVDIVIAYTRSRLKALLAAFQLSRHEPCLESNIRKAYKQNPDIIFINCHNVEANRESVVRQISNAEAKLKTSLRGKIVVWMPDGSTITH